MTGAGGLVGSEMSRLLIEQGYEVVGIDNNMRRRFFGPEGSTAEELDKLDQLPGFRHMPADIRDFDTMTGVMAAARPQLIVHTAAQPSHDWAATDPLTDFGVNANGTHVMLETARLHAPEATFAHMSTSKVYGDTPNRLKLVEWPTRFDLSVGEPYYGGIDTDMSVDRCLHSLFGVSKLSGDLLVQEYGRYFGMPTVCFRPGCVTGPAHAGVELHGFLAYLMKATVTGRPYKVYGYQGKQVRCNISARDLARAVLAFHGAPRPGAVYNIGGGRASACSMLEAIAESEAIAGCKLDWLYDDTNRIGDHIWWISNIARFQADYPDWHPSVTWQDLLREIHAAHA